MRESYQDVFGAYLKIFARLGLDVYPVEASSGAIGGDVNHEFMVPSVVGEDHFVSCAGCGYAANVEAAERAFATPESVADTVGEVVEIHTPGQAGIGDVVEFLAGENLTAADLLKSMAAFDDEGRPTIMLLAGDREVRLPSGWRLFEDDDFASYPSLVKGFIGPIGQQEHGFRVVADLGVARPGTWVTGANRVDHHLAGVAIGRDVEVDEWGSLAVVVSGDLCPRCGGGVELVRSVEAAHTFQLGYKYSDVMAGASFVAEDGDEANFSMGCYGMGVSRLLAVVAEENHDERGLVWPASLAPYQVHLAALGAGRAPEVGVAADELYGRLVAAGVEVLYDDRDVSPGVKFADADLLGIPVRLVIGAKGLARGVVEWRSRATGDEREVGIDASLDELLGVA
jgi:prolyl-tRNA synthetase